MFLFSFGQLGRISFFKQEVNIYAYEVILIILNLVFIWFYKLQPLKSFKQNTKVVLIFICYLYFSYLISIPAFSVQANVVSFLYLLRLSSYLIFLVYFLFFIHKTVSDKKLGYFLHFLVFGLFGITIGTSAGQFFIYPDIRNLWYAGWDPHLNRMVGVFLEPPVSGAVYGLLFFYFATRISNISRFKVFAITILFVMILLTYSRGTYIGFVLTLVFLLTTQMKIKSKYIILFFIIFFAGLFAVSKIPGEGAHLTRTSTISSRIENYQEAFKTWSKNPIFGVGYNHIRYARDAKPAADGVTDVSHAEASFHSSFLVILASAGIIGLILFIYMLYELAKITRFSLYAVLFLSISSLTDNVILHPFILFLGIFLIAVSTIHLSDTSR